MNLKHVLPLLFILSNKILSSSAQTNDIVTITDEQLDSFSYGDKEFKLAIIGDR